MYLSSSLPTDEKHNLQRHVEAYGGKVLTMNDNTNEKQLAAITHCIGEKDEVFEKISQAKLKTLSTVTHISLPTVYVWKCIANKNKL